MLTIRGTVTKLRGDFITKGEIALQKPEIILGAECLVRLALSFVLAMASIFGGYAPFGAAFVAVSGPGIPGIFALVGAIVGYLVNGGFSWALKYIAISVLAFAAAFIFHELKVYQKSWFMPALVSFMGMCIGFVYAADAGWTISATVFFITETILMGGSAYFYNIALSSWASGGQRDDAQELQRAVSLLILGATALIALDGIHLIAGMTLGRLAAQFIVALAAYKGGIGLGSATGVAMGLAMDAAAGLGAPFYSMAYGFAGLLSGVFSHRGRFAFALAFILSNTVSVLWTWDSVLNVTILYEAFVVSLVFMVIPQSVIGKMTVGFGVKVSYFGGVRIREYARGRVDDLSMAFRDLYSTVRESTLKQHNDNDIATVFDRAADACCRTCAMSGKCWHQEYESTLDAMNRATAAMMENGKLTPSDLPEYFTMSCRHLDAYIAAVNDEIRGLLYRRQFQNKLKDSQEAVLGQYADMSAILKSVATELSSDLTFEPILERKLRRYLNTLDFDGDVAVFRDRSGRLHTEIRGSNMRVIIKDREYLDKISAVLGTRLCERRDDVAYSQGLEFLEAEPLAAAVGIASVRKKGEVVNGDQGTYFKTEDGVLYVILSDGMGSGDEAARDSSATVRVLERFLRAGLEPEAALKILDSVMAIKNEADTGYATVDLMGINLFNGSAKVYKYGAAPSYVKRGKTVRTIKGKSLAAGLAERRESLPDVAAFDLEPGSFAVIASDGVGGDVEDRWIRDMISGYQGAEAKELARDIAREAAERSGNEDDITVLTIFLEERP